MQRFFFGVLVFALLSIAAVSPVQAQEQPQAESPYIFGIEARAWFTKLDGDVKVDETTVNGTTIDVKDDLDMDTSEMVPELRLDLRLSEHDRLLAGFTTVSYDGDTAIEQTLTYNGKAYVAGPAST
jgi:hypothetical protein